MSLSGTILNASESSTFPESLLEESTLNDNVKFSKLDLSEIEINESTLQKTQNLSQVAPPTPKLSITLNQEEREILRKNCDVSKRSSVMDTSLNLNDSVQTLSDTAAASGKGTSRLTTFNKMSIVSEDVDGLDESVIPVEEGDDDDVQEVSTLENFEQSQDQSMQKDMFSHLQPSKTSVEKENCEKYLADQEMSESLVEQEATEFQQDESNLFQYPLIEVGRRLWPSSLDQQLYTKGCLWSPDGTCLLVPVHLDGMHIVELPTDLYTLQEVSVDRNLSGLTSAVHVKEGGTVYDCCWYPFMSSNDPASCCWLATRQHEPIHMWDAFSGELRCSYRGYDDVDEVESAISITFNNDGQKVIGGYKKTIKIFDTDIPGRDSNSIPVKQAISCFALTTENDNCVTAGTWTGYINHYDLRVPKLGSLFTLGGHKGGITWLKYCPTQDRNWYLFSGARKDNKILQWDMRNYTQPLEMFERNVLTNQRIYYDFSPLHNWLASGDTEGLLRIWNLYDKDQQIELPLHQDCCNGVSFHPSLPIISTTSGQYHFVDVTESNEKSTEKIVKYENSLLLLWYGPSKEN